MTGYGDPPKEYQFKKKDPRINRHGRPKSFDALRVLAQEVLNVKIVSNDGSVAMSRIQIILSDWSSSRDVRKQQALVEIAYGKVPQKIDLEYTEYMVKEPDGS
jgi:hypothetical protein